MCVPVHVGVDTIHSKHAHSEL